MGSDPVEQQPTGIRPRGMSFDKNKHINNNNNDLIDMSHESTATSSKNVNMAENKKSILEDLNKRKDNLPKLAKHKVLNPYGNLAQRYKESPYVIKVHNNKW